MRWVMRVTVRKINGVDYVYFHESYRDLKTNAPKHKTIKSFGRLDELLKKDPDILEKLRKQAEEYTREKKAKKQSEALESVNRLSELLQEGGESSESFVSRNCGIAIYKHLWEQLKLDNLFSYLKSKTQIEYDYGDIAFFLSAARIISPESKLSTFNDRYSYLFSTEGMELHDIYRALSYLSRDKEAIEKHIYKKVLSTLGRNAIVAFYDVSTYRFESVKSDSLKGFGFSKDGKPNEVQVTMGLLIDEAGIPLGYEIFPGNTSEFVTMVPLLSKLKEKYGIKKLTVVADRGLNSRSNLAMIKQLGYEYIMAYKLRSCGTKEIADILDETGYVTLPDVEGDIFRHKRLPFKNKVKIEGEDVTLDGALVVSFSEKRRRKEEKDRQRCLDKAQEYIATPSKYRAAQKRGSKGYIIAVETEGHLSLDLEKIENQARLDGYYGVVSSDKDLTDEEIINTHHKLWKIEESFRVMKSDLEARPCFVWTEPSIRGHFVLCFIALVLERVLEEKVRGAGIETTTPQLLEAVREAKVVEVETDGSIEYLKVDVSELFDRVSESIGLKILPKACKKNELQRFLNIKI
jgi:transposase